MGHILTIDDGCNTQTQSYTYDAQNRLRSAVVTGGGNDLYDNTGANDYRYSTVTGRITTLGGVDYSYLDSAHDHAVTHLDGSQRYWYDANGNQSKRVTGGNTDELRYDAETRGRATLLVRR